MAKKKVTEVVRDLRNLALASILTDFPNARFDARTAGERDQGNFAELCRSIRERGQDTPGVVRPHPDKAGMFQLICGARRFAACTDTKQATFFAEVRDINDIDARSANLVENLQRQNLSAAEKSMAFYTLNKVEKLSAATISKMVGMAESYIGNLIGLRKYLSPHLWEVFARGGAGCPPQADLLKWMTAQKYSEGAPDSANAAEYQAKMLAAWNGTGPDANGNARPPRDPNAPKKPGEKKIAAECKRAEADEKASGKDKVAASYAQGVKDALTWVLQGGDAPFGEPATATESAIATA